MGQDARAFELLSLSASEVRLALPDVCVMEAISAFDWKRIERNRLKDELDRQLSQLQRSINVQSAQQLATELTRAHLTNAELLTALLTRLDETLLGISNRAELFSLSAEIVRHQGQLFRETELDRDDALILASILAHSKSDPTARKAFLTGNFKDFDTEPVRRLLGDTGIKQFSSTGRVLGWIAAG